MEIDHAIICRLTIRMLPVFAELYSIEQDRCTCNRITAMLGSSLVRDSINHI